MSKSNRCQNSYKTSSDDSQGARRPSLSKDEESVNITAIMPRTVYEEIDRYRRRLGWRSLSSFLAAAAQFAIDKRLENPDTDSPIKFDKLGEGGPDEVDALTKGSNATSGSLVAHRIASHVALFTKVKTAVETWATGSILGGASDYFYGLASEVKESPQKINKMRNIAHLESGEYEDMVEQTSAQIVLDLGQDSRISRSIHRYNVGFILREVLRSNRNSEYTLIQDDCERFMGFVKGYIKNGHLVRLQDLSSLCFLCGSGCLWDHEHFTSQTGDQRKTIIDLFRYASEIETMGQDGPDEILEED